MPLRWQGFAVPKAGNSPEEYEDAFAGNPRTRRFAIADGATESSFASIWARLLVDGFVAPAPNPAAKKDWLKPLRDEWNSKVDGIELPWYAEAKRGLGASATFLGLTLRRPRKIRKTGTWLALAVGDCCCFHIHEDQLVTRFPELNSEDFGNQPALLNSKLEQNHGCAQNHQGNWHAGDRFLLMSDAIAQWFIRSHEEHSKPWQAIARILLDRQQEQSFALWIDELRGQGRMRNDDVTLVIVDPQKRSRP